jgi:hypothetical protein
MLDGLYQRERSRNRFEWPIPGQSQDGVDDGNRVCRVGIGWKIVL